MFYTNAHSKIFGQLYSAFSPEELSFLALYDAIFRYVFSKLFYPQKPQLDSSSPQVIFRILIGEGTKCSI